MSRGHPAAGLMIAVIWMMGAASAAADEPGGLPQDTDVLLQDGAGGPQGSITQLEALLDAQQRKIEQLEGQVTAAAAQDLDQARIEQMKAAIREVLSEKEFRESLIPATVQAGYSKGFFIRSSDDKFSIKVNGNFQFRWTYYKSQERNRYLMPGTKRWDRSGFDIARGRLRFSGHAYTKNLTYLIEFDYSGPGGYDVTLYYASVNYRFADELQLRAGLFRTASTRADMSSTAHLQFVDWPPMNSVFGMGNGLGMRLWGQAFSKRLEYYLDVVNSLGTPNTFTITNDENLYTRGHDNNPAILARAIWHVLTGACSTQTPDDAAHFESFCDIEHHMEPALDVGAHYVFSEDWHDGTLRIPFARQTNFQEGGFGLTRSDGLQINQFGVDAAFKYRGFSVIGEYVVRVQDVRNADGPQYTPLFQLTGDASTAAQQGGYIQSGYFLPIPGLENKLEVVGRIGAVSVLAGGHEATWDYACGLNYYIDGHRVKIQTDLTKVSEAPMSGPTYSMANVNDDILVWRVQLQVAF